jgi:hypothetical protein
VEGSLREGYVLCVVGNPAGPRVLDNRVQRWFVAIDSRRRAAFVWD